VPFFTLVSQGDIFVTVTRPWARQPKNQSSSPGKGKKFFFSLLFRPALVPTQPLIQLVIEGGGAFHLVVAKWLRHEPHWSPQTSAEVKNAVNA